MLFLALNLAKMNTELKQSNFARYALFVLVLNVVVILWGVFLRASLSGDGCGQHWLTCGGEVVPSAPQFKTVVEFTHRLSTGLVFFAVLFLYVLSRRRFARNHPARKNAFLSFAFIIVEALIGAGLVLTGNTAGNYTPTRPLWTMAHLITTFSLLAVLTLAWRFAAGGRTFNFLAPRRVLLLILIGAAGIFLVGMSGSIAALSSMLFPSATVADGVAKDFAENSHILLRLRVSHPILSVAVGVYLIFLAGWLKARAVESASVKRWANAVSVLILIQLAAGALTLLTLAPIVLQLIHLLLADLVWISFVLLSAEVLSERQTIGNRPIAAEIQSATG